MNRAALLVVALCAVTPLSAQDPKVKTTALKTILESSGETLPPDGKWPIFSFREARLAIQKFSKGKKLLIQFQVDTIYTDPRKPKTITIRGKPVLAEKEIKFRGRKLEVQTPRTLELLFPESIKPKLSQVAEDSVWPVVVTLQIVDIGASPKMAYVVAIYDNKPGLNIWLGKKK